MASARPLGPEPPATRSLSPAPRAALDTPSRGDRRTPPVHPGSSPPALAAGAGVSVELQGGAGGAGGAFQAVTPGFMVSPASPVPDCGGLETGKSWNATFLETWSLPAWEFFELPLRGGALQFPMELVGGRPLSLMSFGVKEVFPEAGPSEGGRLKVGVGVGASAGGGVGSTAWTPAG